MNDRQKQLKNDIIAGKIPIVENCSSCWPDYIYTMGDLQAIGWMTKQYTHDSSGEVDGWIRSYYGPNPVRVKTSGDKILRTIKSGDEV